MKLETSPEECRQVLALLVALSPAMENGAQARAVRDALAAHELLALLRQAAGRLPLTGAEWVTWRQAVAQWVEDGER